MRSMIALLVFATVATAQFDEKATRFADVATITTAVTPAQAKPGEVVTVKFTVTPQPGWHTYPIAPKTKQTSLTAIAFGANADLIAVTKPIDPPGITEKASSIKGQKDQIYDGAVTWEFKAVVKPTATAGKKSITFDDSTVQVCDESCFNAKPSDIPALTLDVLAGSVPVPAEYAAAVEAAGVKPKPPEGPKNVEPPSPEQHGLQRKAALPIADYRAKLDAVNESLVKTNDTSSAKAAGGNDLGGLLTAAIFWGFISLVTPCVFPMIPITVSLFLKKSQQSTGGAVKLAAIYCLTIIVVLGLSAVALLRTFREWSVSPEMNVFMGLLFFVFALSLFGMYDIALPGFLLRATEKRRAAGGLMGTVFGALAFSIVSFTCVAPFLGGFAGIAASGNFNTFELTLAGLAFATAFASPFFVLALFPSLLKKLPKSGGWLDTVKAVMGFLELAAAFKFFRTAELRRPPVEYFTYDVVLAAWVMIFAVTGLYLLGIFRLPHDDEPKSQVGVPRLGFAMLFLGLSVYLLPGLFRGGDGKPQRPSGVVFAWVDAFLLPEAMPASATADELPWSADLPGTLETVRQERLKTGNTKYVLVDFTGVTCTNCKYNESNIFPQAAIRTALAKHALVQMYTDDVPAEFYRVPPPLSDRKAEGLANLNFQFQAFKTEQLPLYVLLEPLANGKVRVVDVYAEGKINSVENFAAFLKTTN